MSLERQSTKPSSAASPETDAFLGLGQDAPAVRRELSRWLGHEVFPGDREALVAHAREADATDAVIAALERLPGGRRYHTVYDVWESLAGEPRASAGRDYHGDRR